MSILVHTFDEKRIEASMNKEQLEYLNAHRKAIEQAHDTTSKAIAKIRELSKQLKEQTNE